MKYLSHLPLIGAVLFVASQASDAAIDYEWVLGFSAGYAERHQVFDTVFQPSGAAIGGRLASVDAGFLYGGIVGYQIHQSGWTFGVEGEVINEPNGRNREFTVNNGAVDPLLTKYLPGTIYQGSVRVKYDINDWMQPFLRLGVQKSRDEFQIDQPDNANSYVSTEENLSATVVGLGFEVAAHENSAFRLEYNHLNRRSHNALIANATDGTRDYQFHVNPATHVVKLAWTLYLG